MSHEYDVVTPRRVWVTNQAGERMSVEQMQRSMPYVDVESGTQRRLVTRDPISGLGNLPPERDTLAGSHINHKMQFDAKQRDPITGSGSLGAEYNCMYTTKEPKKMAKIPENDRNPILMEGYIGQELDPMRPHGGRPRNHAQRDAHRDPIAGTGDFGPKEWDPIYKYRGRMRRSRTAHSEIRRDPICGTGQFAPCEGDALGRPGRRSRSAASPRNPITHVKHAGQPRTPPSEPKMRGDPRDPILGAGFQRKEMMDLWLTPENYCFRSYLLPQSKHKQPEPEIRNDAPKKPIRRAPKAAEPKRTKSEPRKTEPKAPKADASAPKKEPTKKKVPAKKQAKKKDAEEATPEKKTLKGKKPAKSAKKAETNGNLSPTDTEQKENEAPAKSTDLEENKNIMEDSLTAPAMIDPLEYRDNAPDAGTADPEKQAEMNSSIMADSLENANLITGDSETAAKVVESLDHPIAEDEQKLHQSEEGEDLDQAKEQPDQITTEEATAEPTLEYKVDDDVLVRQVEDPSSSTEAAQDNENKANAEEEIEEW